MVRLNDVESDNSPSETMISISSIKPLKFWLGVRMNWLSMMSLIVTLSISEVEINKSSLSISFTNNSNSKTRSSSITLSETFWIVGASFTGSISIDNLKSSELSSDDKATPSKTWNANCSIQSEDSL